METPISLKWFDQVLEYGSDAVQRSILFLDILRKRGNDFLENARRGLPPVLAFDYEIVMDGRSLERPVNHDLVRIIPPSGVDLNPGGKRPVVVIDPRAGHGPGIGGSKQDSEIGMALRDGHPVYFVLFYPDPEPGQTYEDVKAAQTRFIEKVKERHPGAEDPAVIGNCQAGWAIALLAADRPDVTGPVVFNGSPLSYFAGVDGKNPMRYRGGLSGGVWITSLLCDLGHGRFDGANLVMNFEMLNPANTLWTKQYNVWSQVDTEEERYLEFEKWWNSYFMMTADEIHFILDNLFMGNRLETGNLTLKDGRVIDLKNLQDPVMVFASAGDNITPPQQALNWIATVYGTVDEIKRCRQTIVYRVHDTVGHLGIFVSAAVARKEHREIIQNIQRLEFLPPGLYEMVIEETDLPVGKGEAPLTLPDYRVRYVEREMEDILALDDGRADEAAFETVARVSRITDRAYHAYVSPWVRSWATEYTAEWLKQLHPLRISRYVFSDFNPALWPVMPLASHVKARRRPRSDDNPLVTAEKAVSESVIAVLDAYREARDATQEFLFKAIYENPFAAALFPAPSPSPEDASETKVRMARQIQADRDRWTAAMETGGPAEGMIRVAAAVVGADRVWDEREFDKAGELIVTDKRLRHLPVDRLKEIARDQSRILQTDFDRAIETLPALLTSAGDRKAALKFGRAMARADGKIPESEKIVLEKIKKAFES